MPETKHFVNDGYGWACKRCLSSDNADAQRNASEDADAQRGASDEMGASRDATATPRADALARFFREGEAEEREPRLSAHSLARWTDDSHRTLRCPRCGVEEEIDS